MARVTSVELDGTREDADIERNEQQEDKLRGLIAGKQKKLSNANFVERVPADIVQRERDSLDQLQQQFAATESALAELRGA